MKTGLNKIEAIKGQISEGIVTLNQHRVLKWTDKTNVEAWKEGFNKQSKNNTNKAVLNSLKHEIKRNDLVATMAMAIEYTGEELKQVSDINIGKESALTRRLHKVIRTLSCDKMSCKRKSVDEILSVSLSSEFLRLAKDKDRKYIYTGYMEKLMMKGITLAYNKKSGFFKTVEAGYTAKDQESILEYKFFGITASGLRSGTLMFALVTKDEKACDRRAELLNKLTGGFFEEVFVPAIEKGEDDSKLFKYVNRLSLSFADSKAVGTANNIIVANKFVDNVEVTTLDGRKITKDQTMDGRFYLSTSVVKQLKELANFSDFVIGQQVVQSRSENGGVKAAADLLTPKYMEKYCREFCKTSEILYVIEDGIRKGPEEVNMEEFCKKAEMLIDTNALKTEAYSSLEINLMKQGYASDSKLTMMVNQMMMKVSQEDFKQLMDEKYKEALCDKLKALGIKIETDGNGNISFIGTQDEGRKNNEAMFASFLLNSAPELAAALMPGLIRSAFSTTVKSCRNLANDLNPQLESKYLVVQSDISAQFGSEILECKPGNIEIYSPEFEGKKRVSGVRNPISTDTACTTYNVVSLGEIAERIANSSMTREQKEVVLHSFKKCKTYAIIPASNYLMEKHDGLDFDIDSKCFILDEKAVEILGRLPEEAVVIGKDKYRNEKTPQDLAVEAFQRKGSLTIPEGMGKEVKEINVKKKGLISLGNVNLKDNSKITDPFVKQFELVNNYFMNSCASIGEIATGNYNNTLLLRELESGSEHSEFIAKKLRDKYECTGITVYESPIVRGEKSEEGFDIVVLDKETCINILRNYQKSDGSVESTIGFLKDCCGSNRYVGETSIDAVKNGYFVVDYFNHCGIIKSMGSDKTVVVTEERLESEFSAHCVAACESLDLKPSLLNPFAIKVLVCNKNKKGDLVIPVGTEVEDPDNVSFAIPDSYYDIKVELIEYTNTLIAICSELLNNKISSAKSEEIRRNFSKIVETLDVESVTKGTAVCRSLNKLMITKEKLVKSSQVINEESSIMANREHLMPRVANTAAIAFDGYSDIQTGAMFVQAMLNKTDVKVKEYGTVNQKCVEVFSRYITPLFESMGADLNCYEKITIAERGMNLKEMAGVKATASHGFLFTEEGQIELDNHKLDGVSGEITEDKMFSFRRPCIELKAEEGIFMHAAPDAQLFARRIYEDNTVETIEDLSNRVRGFLNNLSIVTADDKSKKEDITYVVRNAQGKLAYRSLNNGTTAIMTEYNGNNFKVTGAMDSVNRNILRSLGRNVSVNVSAVSTDDVNIHIIADVNSAEIGLKLRDIINGTSAPKEDIKKVVKSSSSILDMVLASPSDVPAIVATEKEEEIVNVELNNEFIW